MFASSGTQDASPAGAGMPFPHRRYRDTSASRSGLACIITADQRSTEAHPPPHGRSPRPQGRACRPRSGFAGAPLTRIEIEVDRISPTRGVPLRRPGRRTAIHRTADEVVAGLQPAGRCRSSQANLPRPSPPPRGVAAGGGSSSRGCGSTTTDHEPASGRSTRGNRKRHLGAGLVRRH